MSGSRVALIAAACASSSQAMMEEVNGTNERVETSLLLAAALFFLPAALCLRIFQPSTAAFSAGAHSIRYWGSCAMLGIHLTSSEPPERNFT